MASTTVHHKLSTEAGAASASAAAQQARLKQQKKQHQELLEAALTPPPQRTQGQIEQLCVHLSTVHLLRSLQPTALRSLAHAMAGQSVPSGEVLYRQGEAANHLYVVLSGEVAMYEHDSSSNSTSSTSGSQAGAAEHQQGQQRHDLAAAGGTDHTMTRLSGSSRVGSPAQDSRASSGLGLRPPAPPSTQQQQQHSRGASPSSHKLSSPRRLGGFSAGGQKHSAGAGSLSGGSGAAGGGEHSQQGPQWCEVRRVKPREAFGEDDITAGTRREQTAVSIKATKATFQAIVGFGSSSGGSSSSGGGAVAKQAGSSSSGGAAPPTAAAAGAATGAATTDGVPDAASGAAAAASAAATPAALAAGAAAAAASDPRCQCVVLVLSAEDYGATLEGRLTSLLEEKVSFLAGLPAMKGLNLHYLRQLSHCFHQVTFEPREVVVRQGDVSDCMYVVKSGQVCILIDPSLTLAETAAADGSGEGSSPTGASQAQVGGSGETSTATELDTKKLVQVCLLGGGAIIGDMSVRESGTGGGPARRSATVVALTELVTYKVPLKEFKRRMPADVLEGMRQVASQKLEMNGSKAQGRALANGRDGQVLLGALALPECVLQGKGLRALLDAQQNGGAAQPVGGLLQALELCVAPDSPRGRGRPGGISSGSGSGSSQQQTKKWFVTGTKAAQEVEGFMDSLSRNGYVAAPPQEFLALMTDWRSARTNNTANTQQVPSGWVFPLPLPNAKQPRGQGNTGSSAAALSAANSHLHPSMGTLASLTHAACGGAAIDPAVTTHTLCISRPHTPQQQQDDAEGAVGSPRETRLLAPASASAHASSLANQPLMSSPTSLLAALSLDQYIQSPLGSPAGVAAGGGTAGAGSSISRHASRPTTPDAGPSCVQAGSSKGLSAAAVAKDAAQQLLGGGLSSPKAMTRAAGGVGGRGQLLRGQLVQPGAIACSTVATSGQLCCAAPDSSSKTTTKAHPAAGQSLLSAAAGANAGVHTHSSEPTAAEACIKAATLFRPGSPICIGRCGSPRPASHQGSSTSKVAGGGSTAVVPPLTVVPGLTPSVHAAVITSSRTGKQELTFHAAAGPGAALQLNNS